VIRWLVARYVRRWREHCRAQHRAWRGDPDDGGRSDLWLTYAAGATQMLWWLTWKGTALRLPIGAGG